MAKFRVQFEFEQWPVAIEDGTKFVPAKDAEQRWVIGPFPEAMLDGESFRVVYQLPNCEFIQAHLQCFRRNDGRRSGIPTGIWWSPYGQYWKRMSPVEAIDWFADEELPIPSALESYRSEWEASKSISVAERAPRPLKFWVENVADRTSSAQPAHTVDVLAVAERIARIGVACVNQLKEGKWLLDGPGGKLHFLWLDLVSKYPVQLEHWWGPISVLPPDAVGLLELRWPTGTESMRATIRSMKELLAAPLSLPQGRDFDLHPLPAETAMAEDTMRAATDELERLTITLRQSLEEFLKTPCSTPVPPRSAKRPSQGAVDAYRLIQEGKKQEDIALLLAVDQGTVSRWNSDVIHFLESQGALPPMSSGLRKKVHSVDPKHLDMGASSSRRTHRQKDGKRR